MLLLITNAYAFCIDVNYQASLIKYLPLWLTVSEECWPSSVSFPWSSWQTCMQVTEKINDYQELQRSLEPQRQTPHVLYNPVVPGTQSELGQFSNDICLGLSLSLSQSTQAFRALTLQEPAHKRGWAHVTSICQMNQGPYNGSVLPCSPLQEAFLDHILRQRKTRWAVWHKYTHPVKRATFQLRFVFCGT